jgi:hypothetical protein
VAAIGVDGNGDEHVLAVVEGATENTVVVQALLDNLLGRGLDPSAPRLFFVDGAKALTKADLPMSKASVRGGGGAVRARLWRCGFERDHRHGGAVGPRGRRCDLAGVGQHCEGVGETSARHTRNLAGCHFAGRCPYVQDSCRAVDPQIAELADGHSVACLFPLTRERTN